MLKKKDPISHQPDSGGTIIESAILLPVLVILISGVIDLSLKFRDYIFLNQITREIALKGATMPRLTDSYGSGSACNVQPDSATVEACITALAGNTNVGDCGHKVLCWHAWELSKTKNLFVTNNVSFDIALVPDPADIEICRVRVAVSGTFAGVFQMLSNQPIGTAAEYGYIGKPYPVNNCQS